MKTIIKAIWCILVLAVSASAANYTVKSGGGGNYTTIQACANAVSAGDTCTVYAGTYNEYVTLSRSGSSTNPIVLTVNAGDKAQVFGFAVSANYVTINGFLITDPSLSHGPGVDIRAADTGVQVNNNTISQVGGNCIATHYSTEPHYTVISGNTVSWCNAVSGQSNSHALTAIVLHGDHFLVKNNAISHAVNAMTGDFDHSVIVGNTYGPTNDAMDFPGCSIAGGCDTHLDFIEFGQASSSRGYAVIESNNQNNSLGVGGAHAWLGNVQATNVISRFNTQYAIGSGYLANNGSSDTVNNWKDYNNTIINNQAQNSDGGNVSAIWQPTDNGGTFLNNLFYNATNPSGSQSNYYNSSSSSGFVSGYNMAWDGGCSPQTLAHCTTGQFATDRGNVYSDPKLVATDGSSFDLQSDSPAIAAGRSLTTVAKTDQGSGTSLVVNDAGFFQDGYGISGVKADCIAVSTVTTQVCITAVNYQTNTLTLSNSIARSPGDTVWLYSDSTGRTVLIGTAPNIGAGFVPPSGPAPPSSLEALVN
jgi:hypothetical protein